MLVLSRKVGQRIHIGRDVEIVVQAVAGNRVTIGIEAPATTNVRRSELPPLERTDAPEPTPPVPKPVRE